MPGKCGALLRVRFTEALGSNLAKCAWREFRERRQNCRHSNSQILDAITRREHYQY
jgi:hypothetical protein